MFPVFLKTRKALRAAALTLTCSVALAACTVPSDIAGGGPSINASRPVPVALLLPYGTEIANQTGLARSLENAARLAIADLNGVTIDLKVYATAGNAEQAAVVAQEAVGDGAKIILGPVFSAAANAAGVAAARANINVLSFSNNTDIAGGNVFVLGNTFENTARRVVSYAAQQGSGNVFVAYPQTSVGTVGRDAILQAVAETGATAAGSIGYEASQTGVVNAVPQIASALRSSGATALVMADDTSGSIPLLSQLLPENGIDPASTQFVGLTRWDIPASSLALPGLQGGIFALPDPALSAQFADRYQTTYGAPPHPIAGLAYDGIAAIGALVSTQQSRALTGAALTQGSGFAGVTGAFRLRADGTNERALAVARITNQAVTIVSPAQRSFGVGGS
ncbi:penicillin-binding protein activator [Dinoroseobacter sp. S124A]|uniref:penicillin-binding protein activator n=1 Tax=Dinoroseobacter sp. S124A TaxID=3415128 RepID=UPI003C7D2FBA